MNIQQNETEQASASIITSTVPTTHSDVVVQRSDETQTQTLAQEERAAFLARLKQQAQRQKRRYKTLYAAHFVGVTLYVAIRLATHTHLLPKDPWRDFASLIPLVYIISIFGALVAGRKWKRSALELTSTDDRSSIGPLIEAYMASSIGREQQSGEQQNAILDTLIDQLPRLQASDAHLIDTEQRKSLNRLLGSMLVTLTKDRSRLACAILKAYEQIGDSAALPLVEQIASGAKTGKDEAVCKAAQECLPFLRQRLAAEQANQQLLRAADGNLTSADTLLRPAASSTSVTASQQLLRAETTAYFVEGDQE
jgi:hypothetical protein